MGYLPTEVEQEVLFRDLAEVIARRGSAGFLTSDRHPSSALPPDQLSAG